MRIDNDAQEKLRVFTEEHMDIVINNGETGHIKPAYFLANFSLYYGKFTRQQELTDLANAFSALAYKGEILGKAEDIIGDSPIILRQLKEYVKTAPEDCIGSKQQAGVISMIDNITNNISGLKDIGKILHAR